MRKVMSPAQIELSRLVGSLSGDEFEAFCDHPKSDSESLAEARKTLQAIRKNGRN